MELLMEYDWPGNVRELENAIERAVILCSVGRITADDLSLQGIRTVKKKAPSPLLDKDLDLDMIERDAILEALKKTNFVQKDAAKLLGISSRVINYKIKKHNIILPEN